MDNQHLFPGVKGIHRVNQIQTPQTSAGPTPAFAFPVQNIPLVSMPMTSPAPPERKRLKSIGSADAFVMDPFLDFEGFNFKSPNVSPEREMSNKPQQQLPIETFTFQVQEKNKQMTNDMLAGLLPEDQMAHSDDLVHPSQYLFVHEEVPVHNSQVDLQTQNKQQQQEMLCGVHENLTFSKFMEAQERMQMPAGIGSNYPEPVHRQNHQIANHPQENLEAPPGPPPVTLLKPMPDVFEKLATFVAKLAATPVPDNTFNQYSILGEVSPDNEIRRQNLFLYLKQMHEICNGILLVGQACFSKGCRLTGVPFTSEWIILNPWTNAAKISLFGKTRGFKKTSEFAKVTKEASAKIVWKALVDLNQVPLLWHIFPFHPFDPKKSWLSNRSPNNEEMKIGEVFLKELIQIFNIQTILALGKFVKRHLENMDIPYIELSRPSYSGKRKFVQGIKENLK